MNSTAKIQRHLEEKRKLPNGLPAPLSNATRQAGWRWARLEEVCKQDRQIVESFSDEAGRLTYLSLEHIEAETGRILRVPTEQVNDEGKSTTFYFDERHVLYGKLRPYLNKVALPNTQGRCTTEMIPLIPLDNTNREYLAWLLRRRETIDFAMQGRTGSRMPRADMGNLLKLSIPIPSLLEQQRISGVLREQMAAVEKARAAAQARLKAIKALPAAFLRQVFPQPGQPLPDGWRWVKLGDVCELNPRRPFIDRKDSDPTSFIPMEAVDAISGSVSDLRIRPYGEIKKGYTYFADGDVLFAKITPCMQNGKHAIAKSLINGLGFGTTEFHVLRPGKGIISELIWFFVRQPDLLIEATEHFTGAVGQQRLPKVYLANLPIPIPPWPEQRRIAGVLKKQMAATAKAREAAEAELGTINALPAALLHRAFAGEL